MSYVVMVEGVAAGVYGTFRSVRKAKEMLEEVGFQESLSLFWVTPPSYFNSAKARILPVENPQLLGGWKTEGRHSALTKEDKEALERQGPPYHV